MASGIPIVESEMYRSIYFTAPHARERLMRRFIISDYPSLLRRINHVCLCDCDNVIIIGE